MAIGSANPVCKFVLVQGQVNINLQLVLNEIGPGRTSRAWYFHSPGIGSVGSVRLGIESWLLLF